MAFQQGLSGLYASSKALDVTSNNVANSATVGFKSASTHFSDVFANSLAGSGSSAVGIGTSVNAVQQQFTQGNITSTNNPLDICINGNGFFQMSQNGAVTYSRNGQFHLDNRGFIIDDQGRNLNGFLVAGSAATAPLQVNAANQDPVATGSTAGALSGVQASLNLDSGSLVVPSTTAFDINAPQSYNYSTATTIYDSLGNDHSLTFYARKTAASTWDIYSSVDGTSAIAPNITAGSPTSISFGTSGQLNAAPNGVFNLSIDLTAVMAALNPPQTNSATATQTIPINFAGTTQFGSTSGTNSIDQDGYATGRLTGISVSAEGVLRGNYSNGKSRDLGQVALANFRNPNGLTSLGGNQWAETSTSGGAQVDRPNSGTLGVLQSAAVEESNVDLTGELVNMITEQRNYQANAQSIKTQDQIMQTLVNLR